MDGLCNHQGCTKRSTGLGVQDGVVVVKGMADVIYASMICVLVMLKKVVDFPRNMEKYMESRSIVVQLRDAKNSL